MTTQQPAGTAKPFIDVRAENMAQVQAQFKALRNDALGPNIIRSATRAAGKVVVDKAKATVPVRTGKLRKSITQKVDRTRDRTGYTSTIGFKAEAFYGMFIERGTAHQAAQPFLLPALKSNEKTIIPAFFAGIKKRLDKITAKAGL